MTGQPSWWRRMVGDQRMTCLEVGRILQSYLDGEVDEITARRVTRHLESCRRCGLEASTYVEIKYAVARRSLDVPEDAVQRLRRFCEHLLEEDPDATGDEPEAGGGMPG